MNNKKGSKVCCFCLFVTILILVIIGILFFKGRQLKPNSELVNKLYSYLGSNNLNICGGLFNYSDKNINYDDINNTNRICLAYSLLDDTNKDTLKIDLSKNKDGCIIDENIKFAPDKEAKTCTITKIKTTELNNMYNNIYNYNIDKFDNFEINNTTICYYKDDMYYCGNKVGEITYSFGGENNTYRSIDKVYKKNDEIIIYDYFIKAINDDCYKSYTINEKDEICSREYNSIIFNTSNDNKKTKFIKKYGTKYKHIFKKVDNNYYWYETTPVK